MYISPINQHKNNSNSFQAVNQEYLQRAKKEFCRKGGTIGNILDCITFDIHSNRLTFQDGIDTIEAIKRVAGKTNGFIEHVLENFRKNINQS